MPAWKSSVRSCITLLIILLAGTVPKQALLSERCLRGCSLAPRMPPEWEGFRASAQRVHARQAALDAA